MGRFVRLNGSPVERAIQRVVKEDDGCWYWNGSCTSSGYGHLNAGGGKYPLAHVLLFEHFRGPVPEGLELDHLCRNRRCVNPDHLEPVTHYENERRGAAPAMRLHVAGVCARGHNLVTEASRRRSNGRVVYCRACRREKRAEASRAEA